MRILFVVNDFSLIGMFKAMAETNNFERVFVSSVNAAQHQLARTDLLFDCAIIDVDNLTGEITPLVTDARGKKIPFSTLITPGIRYVRSLSHIKQAAYLIDKNDRMIGTTEACINGMLKS